RLPLPVLRLDGHEARKPVRPDAVPECALLQCLPAAVRTVQDRLADEDLQCVAVGDDVLATDTLARKPRGRAPDARAAAALRDVVVDRSRHIGNCRGRLERDSFGFVLAGLAQEDA